MKDTEITIRFNSEKLDALNYYMSRKDTEIQEELEENVQTLYAKYVPAPTREYIEDRLEREGGPATAIPKVPRKPVPTGKKKKKSEGDKPSSTGVTEDSLSPKAEEEPKEDDQKSAQEKVDSQSEKGTENENSKDFLDNLLV